MAVERVVAFDFTLEVEGFGSSGAYAGHLMTLSKLLMSPQRAWGTLLADIGDYFIDRIQEEFDTEGTSWGGWQYLNPDYQAWKEEHYGSGLPMLFLTGEYEQSFGWDPIDDGIIIHSSLESTKHSGHTFGNESNNLPARPAFVVTDEDLDHVTEMFTDQFDALIFNRL